MATHQLVVGSAWIFNTDLKGGHCEGPLLQLLLLLLLPPLMPLLPWL